jgi:drug/metabolite transporter (DMT)-like permease
LRRANAKRRLEKYRAKVKDKTLQPYVWILISGFSFSWMIAFAVLAARATNWQIVAIARCAIPLVLIAAWARWDGVKLVLWGPRILWIRSLAGSCSLAGTFYALSEIPVTDIYTISNIFPIWVALLSWPMLGRFPSGLVWLSILSSVVGVGIMQGAELNAGNYVALIVVGVSLLTAIAMMGLNQLKDLDPRAVVVHFSATALVVTLICACLFEWKEPVDAITAREWIELVGVGVTASIGQFFLTKAFTSGDPAKMSVASLSQFVFILAIDVLFLEHALEWTKVWGIPLVLGPTVWLMMRRVKTSTLAPDPPHVVPGATEALITADVD